MKSSPKVSVLLTSYNRPEWLRQAVESVILQTFADWELLILDDNSSAPAFEVVEDLVDSDERIKFYHFSTTMAERAKTCRYATLINFGSKHSSGEYITYLTDDDFYYEHRLQAMVDRLDADDNAAVVFGKQNRVHPDGTVYSVRGEGSPQILTRAASHVDHNSVMHTRDVAFEVGLWEDGPEFWGHADAVFWTKLNDAGYNFHFINQVLDAHRDHENSAQNKMLSGKMPYED